MTNKNYKKSDLLFLPLGGAGEIGMNLNLYHYQGKWIMIDLGAGFADEGFPGIDLIVSDISFVKSILKDLKGIVLTHAHEDHLGAVQYLWQELRCPIYATNFTCNFLKAKLARTGFVNQIKIHEISEGEKVKLSPFEIETIPITHSTPEMQGLIIRTDLGNIFHTGDWKFDPKPLIGKPTDMALLERYGKEGVLALVGDSTNVFNEVHSGSEGDLRESLIELVKSCKKMVVITTFASNVARIETIIRTAAECGRKVAIAGKSLWRIIDAARDSGYLLDIPEFVDEETAKSIARENLLVIATGCQGEPMAATTKMAAKTHPYLRLAPGDTVIFSSKIIPGNEKKIAKLFNNFVHLGIEVLTEKDHFVHVSGHPSSIELKKMYDLIKPKIAIPVHGELIHMHEHVRLAKEWGVPHSVQVENGEIVRLAPGDPTIVDKVKSGYLGVDGKALLPYNSQVLRMRRKMQTSGIVLVTVITDYTGRLIESPIIKTPGVLDEKHDHYIIEEIVTEIEHVLVKHYKAIPNKRNIDDDTIINITRQAVRRILSKEIGKKPVIDIVVQRL